MDRRQFVSQACITCLGSAFLATGFTGCAATHYVGGEIESQGLSVLQSEFTYYRKDKAYDRQFIIVHHVNLEFPIYLYRHSANEYSALWMKCTHQGSELRASGDHLYCSSHGSEYDKLGIVIQGPAEENLRSFPVSVSGNRIHIKLR
jgi:Rieske Fe-S protein